MIYLKTPTEIELIRRSCQIVVEAFRVVEEILRPGIKTKQIDREVERFILSRGARPAFKGYRGYPASTCISVDEEVVHGIPGSRILEEGQIVSVDIGVERAGYFGDGAKTFPIGAISEEKRRLIEVTRESLYRGIEKARVGNRLFDISNAIQTYVEAHGFSVVRELAGHGVGRDLWEDPQIPNFGPARKGPRLKRGMVLAIEPMVNLGSHEVKILEDDWTVVTVDGSPSAHFEHTVAITNQGPEILTLGL